METKVKLEARQKYIHHDGKSFFTITGIDEDYVRVTCTTKDRPEYITEWSREEICAAIRNKDYTLAQKIELKKTKKYWIIIDEFGTDYYRKSDVEKFLRHYSYGKIGEANIQPNDVSTIIPRIVMSNVTPYRMVR